MDYLGLPCNKEQQVKSNRKHNITQYLQSWKYLKETECENLRP